MNARLAIISPRNALGYGKPIMITARARLSEKLIPSDSFPPTTDNKRAPFSCEVITFEYSDNTASTLEEFVGSWKMVLKAVNF